MSNYDIKQQIIREIEYYKSDLDRIYNEIDNLKRQKLQYYSVY